MRATELIYRYGISSQLLHKTTQDELLLATYGGVTEISPAVMPCFFSGFLTDPSAAAAGMLAVAAVSRARYSAQAGAVAAISRDPVVTSNGDRLRFESFSGCCGVYARLDLLPDALAGAPWASGTTNVDFNHQMRAALAAATLGSGLLLTVGATHVSVTSAKAQVAERSVPLPRRWVKGFGEAQALAASMRLVGELRGTKARRFLLGLPHHSRRPLWAIPAEDSFTLALTARVGAACLAGPHRLGELRPLVPFTRGLRTYGPPVEAGSLPVSSAWEVDLGLARLTFMLSPESYRGFTGEGSLLEPLTDGEAAAGAEVIRPLLSWSDCIDIVGLSAKSKLLPSQVTMALSHLAADGRVGYDLAESRFFRRELPFGTAALDAMQPRLANARALVSAGAVIIGSGGAVVRSGDTNYSVAFAEPDRCTCPWWGRHQGTRGPCKHVLAARLASRHKGVAIAHPAAET